MSNTTSSLSSTKVGLPEPHLTLAILTTKNKDGRIKGNFENFKDLVDTGLKMGFIVYVLPIEHFSTSKKLLQGLIYDNENDQWVPSLMPFPQLIYNRIPYREDESSKLVKEKINRITSLNNVKLFNPTFFNKWQLFRWLKKVDAAQKFLPETKKLHSSTTLLQMLEKHSFLYLKPESGKAGKGILTIRLDKDQVLPYAISVQDDKDSKTIRCKNFDKLWKKVILETQKTAYIAQQGIELNQFNGCRYDLRLLVQKNQLGKWTVSGIGARLAGQASITTHVPRGGKIESPLKLLQSNFGKKDAIELIRKVEGVAVLLASHIEQASQSLLAEMSMDIGVDKQGEIWFFEANAKPMKFDEPHIRTKSLQRIFQYGLYLLNK